MSHVLLVHCVIDSLSLSLFLSFSLSLIDYALLQVRGYEEQTARDYQQHVVNSLSKDSGGTDKSQVSGFIKMHCFI